MKLIYNRAILKGLLLAALMSVATLSLSAQSNNGFMRTKNGWEFELKAGINFVGGTAPMGIPAEIRSIDGYKPRYGSAFEGVATKWLGIEPSQPEWGLSGGLRIESRGMSTSATVKSFHTIVPVGQEAIEGYWTGGVDMAYSATLLSVPLLIHYRFDKGWKVRGGLYCGYQLEGHFGGAVYNGYLRNGTPLGEKVVIDGGNEALYDFSGEMQRWQGGMQLGFSWRAYRHFHINTDFNWGFSNLFKRSFRTIEFGMYPIYLQAGFGYQF